jgi:hypothetical protein
MRHLSIAVAAAAILGATALGTLGARAAEAAAENRTFKVRQEVPVLVTVDIGNQGPSHADMLAFEAAITSDDGTAGILRGILTTVDIPDGAGDVLADRVGQLVFDLGDGSMLVVSGASVYPHQSVEMAINQAQVRAVIGGTGDFIGARGQVTTVRNEDGSYEHSFELLD